MTRVTEYVDSGISIAERLALYEQVECSTEVDELRVDFFKRTLFTMFHSLRGWKIFKEAITNCDSLVVVYEMRKEDDLKYIKFSIYVDSDGLCNIHCGQVDDLLDRTPFVETTYGRDNVSR